MKMFIIINMDDLSLYIYLLQVCIEEEEEEETIEDESDQLSQDLAKVLTPILEKIDGFLGGNYEAPQQVTPIQSFLMELMKSKMNDQPINATIKDITKDKAGKFIKTEKP